MMDVKKAVFYTLLAMAVLAITGCGGFSWDQWEIAKKKLSTDTSSSSETGKAALSTPSSYNNYNYSYGYARVALLGRLPDSSGGEDGTGYGDSFSAVPLQQHTFVSEGACFDPAVSPDGKYLAFASTKNAPKPDIYIKPVAGTVMTQLTSDPAGDLQPVFSPDGQQIAFVSDRTGSWDIFVMDINGRNVRQLTDDPAAEFYPTFSPDGKKIAYSRYNAQTDSWEIWLLYIDNPGRKKFITTGLFPRFSPLEDKIVYQRPRDRKTRLFSIWMVSVGKDDQPSMPTEIVSLPSYSLILPSWSIDGKKIVYCAVSGQSEEAMKKSSQIWVVFTDGHGRMPITDPGPGCFSPVWSRDGRIFFCSARDGAENIWSIVPFPAVATDAVAAAEPPSPPHEDEGKGFLDPATGLLHPSKGLDRRPGAKVIEEKIYHSSDSEGSFSAEQIRANQPVHIEH